MKAIHPANALRMPNRVCLVYTATTILCFLLCLQANAKFTFQGGDSSNITVAEKKVDYLEQIYFSGGGKDSLDQQILIAIQGKAVTPSLVKQVTFLLEVHDNVSAAAGTVGEAQNMGKKVANVLKGFGLGGNKKACDDVPQKEIVLGEHKALPQLAVLKTETPVNANQQTAIAVPVPTAGTINLTIKNVTFSQMGTIKPSIEKMAGVTSVSTIGYGESIAVISVASGMKPDELAYKILEANKPLIL